MGSWCVYVLESGQDGKHYIGISQNVEARLQARNVGKVYSTKRRRPFHLIGSRKIGSLAQAREIEVRLKAFKDPVRVKDWIADG